MNIFKLPDLGEGLPDAIIREWHVKIGDEIKTDDPMVAMETAKALVDVPAPFSGKVEKLFGEVNDTIDTGAPLIGFEGEGEAEENADAGTVVGNLESATETITETAVGIATTTPQKTGVKATPAVRMLAKQLNVDLNNMTPKGDRITAEDVKNAAKITTEAKPQLTGELTQLSGVRRAMAMSMTESHHNVVPASIMEEADLHAWAGKQDITIRILRALSAACQDVPILNAYYDGSQMAYQLNEKINIGIAVDTEHGLFAPVIKDVGKKTDEQLREALNLFKKHAAGRSFPQEELKGATIIMSNVGAIAGLFAAPVIVPPMVSIVAFGRIQQKAIIDENGKPAAHRVMPISITFDHRPATGGDAARFLKVLVKELEESN